MASELELRFGFLLRARVTWWKGGSKPTILRIVHLGGKVGLGFRFISAMDLKSRKYIFL